MRTTLRDSPAGDAAALSSSDFPGTRRGWISARLLPVLQTYRGAATVAVIGGIISLLLFADSREQQHAALATELRELAQSQVDLLKENLHSSITILHSIRSLFAASTAVSRAQFDAFVRDAFARQLGLGALSWNPRVRGSDRATLEERTRAEGFPSFGITELDASGGVIPAAHRAEYFPVHYIAPMAGNEAAFGFDVNSDPQRRAALERARDTAAAIATAPIHLAQETGGQLGFFVSLPVFETANETSADQPAPLIGYAVAVFRIGDLVASSLRKLEALHLAVSIRDNLSGRAVIYRSANTSRARDRALEYHAPIDVAGRTWTMSFVPTENFTSHFPVRQPWTVLGLGLVITSLLAGYFVRNTSRTTEVQRRVAERTLALSSEVAERKRAEEALQRAQHDLASRVRERTDELRRSNDALLAEILVRKRAEDAADAANKAKSRFLANMSHEIRTPLNAILGYSEILHRGGELQGFARDAITTMANSGRHLLNLVNDVLDLSKIEAGRTELQPVDFELDATLRGVIAMFLHACEEANLKLLLEGCDDEHSLVYGDEEKLRKVLINLVGNAVKFTAAGEIVVTVARVAEDLWRFEVADTGRGIAPAEQARIFEAFHRAPGSEQTGGTGLGLAIARREVALLGGKLELESRLDAGSKFYFTVPLAPPAHAASSLSTAPRPEVFRLAPGQSARVIVADDVPENRDVLSRILSGIGCEVYAVPHGVAALEFIAQGFVPEIVFLDVNMPLLDGPHTARALLEKFGPNEIKIVLLSASALEADRIRYLQMGCHDFVAVPYRAARIFDSLAKLLGVEYEYAAPVAQDTLDFARMILPEDLALRLLMAAELHSTTVMKSCLVEMEQLGGDARRLAEHLRGFMFSYDLESVLKIVSQVQIEPEIPKAEPTTDKT